MEWLSLKQLVDLLGMSHRHIRRIVEAGSYKKIPLQVREVKSQKGKPTYLIYWNTGTGLPVPNNSLIEIVPLASPSLNTQAVAVTGGSFFSGVGEVVPVYLQSEAKAVEVLGGDYSGKIITPARREEERVPHHFEGESAGKSAASSFLEKPADMSLAEWFEIVLMRKLNHIDNVNSRKSLASLYRKHFKKTGEIHPAVLIFGKAAKLSGRKSTLPQPIIDRFLEMVHGSVDKTNPKTFKTHSIRKVTQFHFELELEFKTKIEIAKLYSVVKKHKLQGIFEKRDDEQEVKEASFFPVEPVGRTIQMDGVTSDYFKINVNGKWMLVTFIEFFDLGSRKLLAMHAYLSESSENSVDIWNRFLGENKFACKEMLIRPDNAGGFLNLQRCIKEMNNRYARPKGFSFIDDYARAGTPKDKAHLESSHRRFHTFESRFISHFKDRIVEQKDGTKKVGNQLRTVTMTHLDISLQELNDSGLIQEYMDFHNTKPHRFTEDGKQKRWIPNDRWDKYLAENETFEFNESDFEINRIYGYPKVAATISKVGLITYKGTKFEVTDAVPFSRQNSTKVKISNIGGGKLALFVDAKDGVYLGEALALKAPKKSQAVIDLVEEKRERAIQGGTFKAIKDRLEECGVMINEGVINEFIDKGLTFEVNEAVLLANNNIRVGDAPPMRKLSVWRGKVKEALGQLNQEGVVKHNAIK
jgi:hypothetical protein